MHAFDDILDFWFVEHGKDDWFTTSAEFDRKLANRFAETHEKVARGEGFVWRSGARGRVAEIIVLDQFSRQLHRGEGRAFAQDGMAIVLAQELVARGLDGELSTDEKLFAYMPYMHSESLAVHEEGMGLFATLSEEMFDFEKRHRDVIATFGRFPKRNAALGRLTTPEEQAYIEATSDSVF